MAQPLTAPYSQFFDNDGRPLAGGKVYTYVAGTNTPQDSYTDSGGLTPASNPVILNSAGRATIWLAGYYKITVTDANGVVIETTDNITVVNSIPSGSISNTDLAVMGANTIKANATGSSASPTDVALSASSMLGRGSSGNIAPITLGSGMLMTGTVLSSGGGLVLRPQIFTASGTYTPHANMLYCIVELVGGGGGSGGSTNGTGGGAGGYSWNLISKATIGASQAVTIGAAGTGGSSLPTVGTQGGTTSLGALMSATGGAGGGTAATSAGAGGAGTGGLTNVNGHPAITKNGGSGPFGTGGAERATVGVGNAGSGYGSGAGGPNGAASAGNSGTTGYLRVIEFCSS